MSNGIHSSSPSLILRPRGLPSPNLRKQNAIVLTSGLTGSSVLTGLISRAGYWTGDSTIQKKDYNTYENQKLVDLNLSLLDQAGFKGAYASHFSQPAIGRIADLPARINVDRYLEFIGKCNAHQPWIWKDPRLWMTIRFWHGLVDFQNCGFVFLTRGYFQSWVSATSRRLIRSYGHVKLYERKIEESILEFLEENRLPYLHISYEDLIVRPEPCIARLNRCLGTTLTVEDLRAIYRRPLYQSPGSSWPGIAKAVLIYLKNYRDRVGVKDVLAEDL